MLFLGLFSKKVQKSNRAFVAAGSLWRDWFGRQRQHRIRHRLEVQVRHEAVAHGEDAEQRLLQCGRVGLPRAQGGLHQVQGQIGQYELFARGEVAGRNRRGLRQGVRLPNKG